MQNDDFLLNQFVLLLAGSGMTDEEIIRLVRLLRSFPRSLLLEQVNMRRGPIGGHMWDDSGEPVLLAQNGRSSTIDSDAINTVERLLVYEAKLPKAIAAAEIKSALARRHPKMHVPPFNSKDGFAKWLSLIANLVSLAELLHIAASLRNELVRGPSDDWIKGKNAR